MKKLLFFGLLGSFLFTACSVETEVDTSAENLSYDLANEEGSVIGIYKGVFTTNNAKHRGTVEIAVPNKALRDNTRYKGMPRAKVTMHNGDVFYAKGTSNGIAGKAMSGVLFVSKQLSFTLSVDQDGTNPTIENVIFDSMEGAILLAKHTKRAPVNARSGTWACTTCNGHPVVGQGGTQTFNMMFVTADGNSTIMTQSTINSTVTDGIGVQENCSANGTTTVCDIISGDGSTTNTGFNSNGKPVTWSGTHTFNNEPSGVNDCSTLSGTWQWPSNSYGLLTGNFITDAIDNCPGAATTLINEDFEDTTVAYTAMPSDDLTDAANRNYYGIVTPATPLPSTNTIDGILGNNYYGAEDTDSATNPSDPISLVWTGLDISAMSTITFSGYFAEDEANDMSGDWDTNSSVRIEYAIDGGAWTPAIAYESELGGDGNETNEFARLDTNFDGTGDGALLTDVLTQQSNSVAVSGATMDVRIIIEELNTGDEDIALDNIRVTGN